MSDTLDVVDFGSRLQFTFGDLRLYSGPRSIGGLAHSFRVMQRVFPLLSPDGPPERREIRVRTAHPGPGVRDGIEFVTRAVVEDRFRHDPQFARIDGGDRMAWWVFEFAYRDRIVTAHAREEFVPEDLMRFALLGRKAAADERGRFLAEIEKMSKLVLAARPDEIYDIVEATGL
ncbi:hypothetical protein [Antrihabitans spumae]|uniref:Uncharacterized protein n=1 Tax=Antrihabitans spumae TaxID=3373370 RepID=A0ABW7KUD0_9NOCA